MMTPCSPHVWHECCITYYVPCKILQGEVSFCNSRQYDPWFHSWNKCKYLITKIVWIKTLENDHYVKIVKCDAYVFVEIFFMLMFNFFFFSNFNFIFYLWDVNHIVNICVICLCIRSIPIDCLLWLFKKNSFCFLNKNIMTWG